MGNCQRYNNNKDCCPKVTGNDRIKDAYNLDGSEKWELAYDILSNSLFTCPNGNNFYSYNYDGHIIEISNKNGTMIEYIVNTCIYDDVKMDKNMKVKIKCNNDSEYFYNKCVDNYCVFY